MWEKAPHHLLFLSSSHYKSQHVHRTSSRSQYLLLGLTSTASPDKASSWITLCWGVCVCVFACWWQCVFIKGRSSLSPQHWVGGATLPLCSTSFLSTCKCCPSLWKPNHPAVLSADTRGRASQSELGFIKADCCLVLLLTLCVTDWVGCFAGEIRVWRPLSFPRCFCFYFWEVADGRHCFTDTLTPGGQHVCFTYRMTCLILQLSFNDSGWVHVQQWELF